jgi:hypothetical protein
MRTTLANFPTKSLDISTATTKRQRELESERRRQLEENGWKEKKMDSTMGPNGVELEHRYFSVWHKRV